MLPNYIIGHVDIAPNRKIDPAGVMFPRGKLYNNYGIGAWLDDDEMNETITVEKYKPDIMSTHNRQKAFSEIFKYLWI